MKNPWRAATTNFKNLHICRQRAKTFRMAATVKRFRAVADFGLVLQW